jgi:hypothetical protein
MKAYNSSDFGSSRKKMIGCIFEVVFGGRNSSVTNFKFWMCGE